MTASKYVKSKGLPSLAHVARMVGKDKRTLYKWYEGNKPLFETIVAGCKAMEDLRRMKE